MGDFVHIYVADRFGAFKKTSFVAEASVGSRLSELSHWLLSTKYMRMIPRCRAGNWRTCDESGSRLRWSGIEGPS